MEIKKGDKTVIIPAWLVAAGIGAATKIVITVCKTIKKNRQ